MSFDAKLELYWLPLGAGACVVRRTGRLYERLVARWQHRPSADLYHSALIATVGDDRWVIEMTPVPDGFGAERRGVVGDGAVGSKWLGRLRVFRYEVHCWRNGTIPDLDWAVASPVVLSTDPAVVRQVCGLSGSVPTPVWGRDELGCGEMWNSNSVVSWLLTRAGLIEAAGEPPNTGRAPGWRSGVIAAEREQRYAADLPPADAA